MSTDFSYSSPRRRHVGIDEHDAHDLPEFASFSEVHVGARGSGATPYRARGRRSRLSTGLLGCPAENCEEKY